MLLPPLLLAAALSIAQLNPIDLTVECASLAAKDYSGKGMWSYINQGGTGILLLFLLLFQALSIMPSIKRSKIAK
jgi:hypothetical protein